MIEQNLKQIEKWRKFKKEKAVGQLAEHRQMLKSAKLEVKKGKLLL